MDGIALDIFQGWFLTAREKTIYLFGSKKDTREKMAKALEKLAAERSVNLRIELGENREGNNGRYSVDLSYFVRQVEDF